MSRARTPEAVVEGRPVLAIDESDRELMAELLAELLIAQLEAGAAAAAAAESCYQAWPPDEAELR